MLICDRFKNDFNIPSYSNFVTGMNRTSRYMLLFMFTILSLKNGAGGDVCFVDGTKIEVCKIYRESRCKTMKGLATKSKSTIG